MRLASSSSRHLDPPTIGSIVIFFLSSVHRGGTDAGVSGGQPTLAAPGQTMTRQPLVRDPTTKSARSDKSPGQSRRQRLQSNARRRRLRVAALKQGSSLTPVYSTPDCSLAIAHRRVPYIERRDRDDERQLKASISAEETEGSCVRVRVSARRRAVLRVSRPRREDARVTYESASSPERRRLARRNAAGDRPYAA